MACSITEGLSPTTPVADVRNRPKQYLFSPFFFLRQMLVSPEFGASDAYAHALIRAELFALTLEFSERIEGKPDAEGDAFDRVRAIIRFDQVANSLQKAESYRENRDTFYPATPTDFIVGHLLASRGLAVLAFAPGKMRYQPARKNERPLLGRDTFLAGKELVSKTAVYEFRFLDTVRRLPSPSELVNELDGYPVPLPGGDAIFARGLRSTGSNGLVGQISGASGSGKTSLALALGISYAPLGVSTLYVSCEEQHEDLRNRILTLTPPFIARTASFPRKIEDWFYSTHLDHNQSEHTRKAVFDFIDEIIALYQREGVEPSSQTPPGLPAWFVVFDGLHEMVSRENPDQQVELLRSLVSKLRSLGAFVLILTAEIDSPALRELDYTVDFVARLDQDSNQESPSEYKRKFILHKTRLQFARTGTHTLHISKRDGVKLYPHLSAELDSYAHLNWKAPDKQRYYDFLLTGVNADDPRPLVEVFERAQILVAGRGSTGKAGFALKLLMKPILGEVDTQRSLFDKVSDAQHRYPDPRRIMVVSFLYNSSYYQDLQRRIETALALDSREKFRKQIIFVDHLPLYPGFLAPEVFLSKVIEKYEGAAVSGCPYHGVLIDGLHNVFLQFPRLQATPTLWSILFQLMRLFGLTLVTTHTHFDVHGLERPSQFRSDVELASQRVSPLLQALVNSADFYFDLSRTDPTFGIASATVPIELVTALGQDVRPSQYGWDRERSVVVFARPK
ncbi:ATPase domain-containing protein [Hyphomicrobium sp. D-2]|uniref:RAD55 family ATPase n=1 Tax=Hyphomicrobium sp. D-2 TaxID=3041621 RepID=UPI002453C3F8|nr:ATPase domain-containing protein [Hyphomicrobium sp. D-2]MDH4981876.1 ATPase domain-containing protein [Hyphomicrobium sp. D-2]